jgi:hypothetical protein
MELVIELYVCIDWGQLLEKLGKPFFFFVCVCFLPLKTDSDLIVIDLTVIELFKNR